MINVQNYFIVKGDLKMAKQTKTSGCPASGKKKSSLSWLRQYLPFYIMLVPVLLYYTIFCYGPLLGQVMAFQNYTPLKGFFGSEWVGFKHFIRFFSNGDAWFTLGNTLHLSIRRLLFGFISPVIFAVLLNEVRHKTYKKIVQTVTYLPHFISWVIIYGVLYNVFSLNGIVNQIRGIFGGESIAYLAEAAYFRPLFVISAIWKELGWQAIVYLAALTAIDTDLYEAAMVDGANRLRRMWHITLPAIRSTIVLMLILRMGSVLDTGYDHLILMANPLNRKVSQTLDVFVYQQGIQSGQFSYASAIGLMKSIISVTLVLASNKIAHLLGEQGLY